MIVAYVLLAAPVLAAVFFWGAWAWFTAAVVVAGVEYVTLRHSQQFSARLWRSVGMTARSRRERGIEKVHVISALAGIALLIRSLLS